MKAISLVLILLTSTTLAFAQVDEARQAIDQGEYVRAVSILSAELADRPTPEAYLLLGTAYSRMKEYQKAQEILEEGAKRYVQDSRFHNQLADLFIENKDTESAKSELREALVADPKDRYASDLLATIDMSEGDIQSALRSWNRGGRPIIDDILHNYYLNFSSWVVRRAVTFRPAGVLYYNEWKTSEARLFETDNFANVGLEIEPTPVPDQYNAIVRTTAKTNNFTNFMFGIVKGAPLQTAYFDLWNMGNSGINFNANYRVDTDRRRVEGQLKIPLPLAALTYLELGSSWRDERWDLSPSILPQFLPSARLLYKATALRIHLKQIPHYRLELGAGFEYRNRAARGDLPQIFTNSLNTGVFSAELNFRGVDGSRYQNWLHLEAFAARESIIGNAQFTGGVAELKNRYTLSKDTRTYFNWSFKGATSRGALPVEDYFVLGLDLRPPNLLRGHTAADHGRYGNAPMATDFVLVNTGIERRLATLPLFNSVNIPFITVKWELFFDGAKSWDRTHVFKQGKLFLDVGGGLRFETPTHSFNIGYGRSLRDGQGILFGYYVRRLW